LRATAWRTTHRPALWLLATRARVLPTGPAGRANGLRAAAVPDLAVARGRERYWLDPRPLRAVPTSLRVPRQPGLRCRVATCTRAAQPI